MDYKYILLLIYFLINLLYAYWCYRGETCWKYISFVLVFGTPIILLIIIRFLQTIKIKIRRIKK